MAWRRDDQNFYENDLTQLLTDILSSPVMHWTSGANHSQRAKFLFVATKQASKLNDRKNALPSFLMWTDIFVAELIFYAAWCYYVSVLALVFLFPSNTQISVYIGKNLMFYTQCRIKYTF